MENIKILLQTHWGITGEIEDISKDGLSGSLIYKIKTNSSDLILKGYPEKIISGNINKVHEMLLNLEKNNFTKVPKVIKLLDSTTSLFFNSRNWEVLTFEKGSHLKSVNNSDALNSLAITISDFHRFNKNIKFDENSRSQLPVNKFKYLDDTHYLDTVGGEIKEKLMQLDLFELFEEFGAKSREVYYKFLDFEWLDVEKQLPTTFIHSDLSKKNILFVDSQVSAIIDFESTKFGPRIIDIARLPIEFSDCNFDILNQFLTKYDERNKLLDIEKETFLRWVHALNIGVNQWALKFFINNQLDTKDTNSNYLIGLIKNAITIQNNLKS